MRDHAEHPGDDRADRPGNARGRQTADAAGATAHAAAQAVAARGTLSPAMVLALQRSAGNAAVVQLLERQRHQHGAACGHQHPGDEQTSAPPTVQRSAVSDVLRSPGQALAEPVRTEMEARLGADFRAVRLHKDTAAARSATEIGARAYTSGNHVVIGAGGADKHTLAHELTHVIQQRQGPVAGTETGGGLRISDPSDAFERAAEANANRVMSGAAPTPAVGERPGTGVGAAGATPTAQRATPATAAPAPAVQRALVIADRDYSAEYATKSLALSDDQKKLALDNLINDLEHQILTAFMFDDGLTVHEWEAYESEKEKITHQLRRAITAPIGHKGHHPVLKADIGESSVFGAKNHDIRVNNVAELARGVMGWVYAKQKRKTEKTIALHIQDTSGIEYYLNSLLMRIYAGMESMKFKFTARQFEVMEAELTTGLSHLESQPKITSLATGVSSHDPKKAGRPVGAYLAYFNPSNAKFAPSSALEALATRVPASGGMLAVLKNPENFDFRDKMMVLHDLMEYFGAVHHGPPTMGSNQTPALADEDTLSTAEVDATGHRRRGVHDRGQNPIAQADGTFKEHPSTRNENSDTTKLAREYDLPVWAGQSYTAARMFKLAQSNEATKQEIAAVAWGIFSFWRIHYDHTTQFAYHTLHEVMDIAQNFGLDYSVNSPYAGREIFGPGGILHEVTKLQAQTAALDKGLLALESMANVRQGAASSKDEVPALPEGLSTGIGKIREPLKLLQGELRLLFEDKRCNMEDWAAGDKRTNSEFLMSVLDSLRDVSGRLGGLERGWQDLKRLYPPAEPVVAPTERSKKPANSDRCVIS